MTKQHNSELSVVHSMRQGPSAHKSHVAASALKVFQKIPRASYVMPSVLFFASLSSGSSGEKCGLLSPPAAGCSPSCWKAYPHMRRPSARSTGKAFAACIRWDYIQSSTQAVLQQRIAARAEDPSRYIYMYICLAMRHQHVLYTLPGVSPYGCFWSAATNPMDVTAAIDTLGFRTIVVVAVRSGGPSA